VIQVHELNEFKVNIYLEHNELHLDLLDPF